MSEIRKKQWKRVGAITIGTITLTALFGLVGGILTYFQTEVSALQANAQVMSVQLAQINSNTSAILAYLCSQQRNIHCSLPSNASVNLAK